MSMDDIAGVMRVADEVHPDLPESEAVFRERLDLFPEGCLALDRDGKICGYAISHPIRQGQPPALDSLIGRVHPEADQYYVHDLAIVPQLRGCGLAAVGVARLLDVAGRYRTTCLVSVYGTMPFWRRFGFEEVAIDDALAKKLDGYGSDSVYLVRRNEQ